MITVTFSTEEINVLGALINVAVQAKGLEAAEAGVHFAKKFQEAVKNSAEDKKED
jgi:hypothetical protein